MSVINPLNFDKIEIKEETHYHGVVVNNSDPLKIGRVKVRIEELFGDGSDISNDALPWCARTSSPEFGGSSNISSFSVPEIGSKLLVKFLRGDIYSPIYVGRVSDFSNKLAEQETDYPNTYIPFKDKIGNKAIVNMAQKTVDITLNGDFTLNIVESSGKGNIIINIAKDVTLNCKNATVVAEEKVQIDCVDSEVNATGSAKVTSPTTTVDGDVEVTGNMNVTGDIICNTITDNQGNLALRKANVTSGSSSGQWPLVP